jgi:hypothetical protein
VGGDQLLLLVQGVEESKRVHAEADDGEQRKRQQRAKRRQRHPRPLAHLRWGEYDERDHQAGGGLHSHAGEKRNHGRAQPWL